MLFSQYLLDKQILTVEQVLTIMLEQLTSVPSVPEIIEEQGLLPKIDLLQILFRQQIFHKDFLTSSYELGLMKQEILEKIMAKVASKQKSFTEIALEKGFITSELLSKEAVNYSEFLTNKKINGKVLEIKNNEIKNSSNEDNTSILDPINGVNKSMVIEYLNCFEQSLQPYLIKLIEKFKNSSLEEEKIFEEVKKIQAEFVAAKAAANFINAKISENISADCVKYLENIFAKKRQVEKESFLNFLNIAFEILTNLYISLKKDGKEQDSDNSLQEKIKILYSIISSNL